MLPQRLRRPIATPASALPWYGLTIFTVFFVTARLPNLFTEVGIYLALLGLLLRPQDIRFPPPLRWAVVFLLWALLTVFFSTVPETAFDGYIERLRRW